MADKKEYYEAAYEYVKEHHSQADNDFQNAMNIAVQKAFVAGVEWAEERFMKMVDEAHKAYSKDNDYARINAIADLIVKIKQGLPF